MPCLRKRTRETNAEDNSKPAAKKRKVTDNGTQVKVVKEEPDRDAGHEDNQDTLSDSDMEGRGISEFMKRREDNIRLNQEFFQKFGIEQAKLDLLSSQQKPTKPTQRGLKKEKVKVELLPRRSSLRLQNKTPEGGELPPESLINRAAASYIPYTPDEHPRPPGGALSMANYLYKTSTTDDHELITKSVNSSRVKSKSSTAELNKYIASISRTKLAAERVAKVVPERSFSVAFHPSDTKILAATGDKWGKLGIWDVECDESSGSDGVCCYAPHSRPITGLQFPMATPHKVYTCGYDGSLRCGDLNKGIFDEVYSIPEEEDILLRNFSFTSPHTMLVSQNTGCVALVDSRTNTTNAELTYELHKRSLRTVSIHPLQTHIFCTAGVEGTLCVWDLRKVRVKTSLPICTLAHGRAINSAYFSPVTGKYILSTSMDDKLTIFDTSEIGPNIKPKKIISHNNHTGRWLTGFRASWHPARDDVFVVGSMNRPREISLYDDEGKKIHSFLNEDYLGSVCSLNDLHPSRDIVVGANSSGRLHVFM